MSILTEICMFIANGQILDLVRKHYLRAKQHRLKSFIPWFGHGPSVTLTECTTTPLEEDVLA